MRTLSNILASWLTANADTASALADLDACTANRAERDRALGQAVLIAQVGGIDDDTLMALLHLAVARQMTPGVVRALRDVGIDTDHFA